MAHHKQPDSEDIKIQGLFEQYLRLKISANDLTGEDQHLDEDYLAAFVEGNLKQRETQPVVKHLVNCSFCRHKTTELVKLDLAFANEELKITVDENQPSKVSEVLSGLLSRIFGNSEEAVFAHQEKEENSENQKKLETDKK